VRSRAEIRKGTSRFSACSIAEAGRQRRRENLNFAAGLAAHLLGLEVLKQVSGVLPSPTVGRIAVFDLVELSIKKHVVLRKPWCPACFPTGHD
jgi:hypothetical protein